MDSLLFVHHNDGTGTKVAYLGYMPISLPYRFDTSPVVQLILRGVLGLLVLVIAPGILYSLFISQNLEAAVLLLVIGLVTIYFGRLFLRNLMTSRGRITGEAVEVEPGMLFGTSLRGSGTTDLAVGAESAASTRARDSGRSSRYA